MAFKGRLYKFKESNELNVTALLNNRLWISNVYNMNDPMDLCFYIDKNKVVGVYSDDDVILFQKDITSHIYCASFTTIYSNKRLWNYYSGGFTGFVVGYKSTDITNVLKKIICMVMIIRLNIKIVKVLIIHLTSMIIFKGRVGRNR